MTGQRAADAKPARLDRTQLIAAVAWIALSIGILVAAAPLAFYNRAGSPGPGFFLKWLSIVLLAFGILRVITIMQQAWAGDAQRRDGAAEAISLGREDTSGPEQPIRWPQMAKFLLMGLALAAYAVLLPILGFLVATAALCWATMVLLGRGALRSLVEAVIAALLVRYVFTHGLGVPLPEPQVEILRFLRL